MIGFERSDADEQRWSDPDVDGEERPDDLDENPRYGPGNPDWERNFEKDTL